MTQPETPDLDVRAAGAHEYEVAVVAGERSAQYRLSVPGPYLEGIGAEDRSEPAVARLAAELLAEQGVAPDGEISLDRVEAECPGFEDRLRAALRR